MLSVLDTGYTVFIELYSSYTLREEGKKNSKQNSEYYIFLKTLCFTYNIDYFTNHDPLELRSVVFVSVIYSGYILT